MKIKVFVILVVGFLFVPAVVFAGQGGRAAVRQEHQAERQAHHQQQVSENKALRQSLKGKTAEEKATALKANRETQYGENKTFNATLHQENMTALQARLANNTKLSEAQKTELVNHFESQYQENVSFRDERYSENTAFFDQVANDANMTQEQKKAAIKAHFDAQKVEAKEHVQQQRSENKALRQEIRSEVQTQMGTGSENK
jgi:hypothetical protein